MTLDDLTEHLAPAFPPSVQKDLKTAVRVLARALTYTDPKSCPLEVCLQPLPRLYQAVETSLTDQGKSPHTIRNTKNNLSRLFRMAAAQGLLTLPAVELRVQFSYSHKPPRVDRLRAFAHGAHLPRAQWPPEVDAEFTEFIRWATDPLVPGRPSAWKKRTPTLRNYEISLRCYFGFLHHELQIRPVTFNHLFDFALIERFVHWHINARWHRATRLADGFVRHIHAMASQYRPDPALAEALKGLRKRMPPLRTVYDKSNAWIPLHELERVGAALWPTKTPDRAILTRHHAGIKYASRAGYSLMLRLWVHIPYRQRNMREMQLDHNLYRTPEGQWRLRFSGEELKIAQKNGQLNVFDLPFPPALVGALESYLTTWRPLLAQFHHPSEVFLNKHGRPHTEKGLRDGLGKHIYSFTGLHWHPHIMRTIWATEWIQSGGDLMTAAIMLNDRLETIIKNYSHLRDANVAENAYQWVQKRVNGH